MCFNWVAVEMFGIERPRLLDFSMFYSDKKKKKERKRKQVLIKVKLVNVTLFRWTAQSTCN